MSGQVVGIFIGIALGVIWIALGFGAVLLCVVLGILGWVVAGVAQGTIHVGDIMQDLQGRRRSAEE
ncbi:MAG TPA: hypothetical protein VH393_17465 [Ktedonobacterales bacterium]|jgi:hypothetical protein